MSDSRSIASSKNSQLDNCRCDYSYLRRKGPKFEGETTNHASYKPHPIEKQPVYELPKPVKKHYDPDVLKSSYNSQFTKPKVDNYQSSGFDSNALAQSYL